MTDLLDALLHAAAYALVGGAMLVVAYYVLDLATPGHLGTHLRGVDALYQMLECPITGTFAFVPQPPAAVKSKNEPLHVMPLLFEGIRRHDEYRQLVLFVPDDPSALDTALLQGRALAECAPQSPVRPAVRSLAEKVAGAPAGSGRRRRRGLRVSR